MVFSLYLSISFYYRFNVVEKKKKRERELICSFPMNFLAGLSITER